MLWQMTMAEKQRQWTAALGGLRTAQDLNNTEWIIQMVPAGGGKPQTDTISFVEGKFLSAQMDFQGFTRSNYSASQESGGKLVWETMQTLGSGTASWRAEIENERMQGVLSLRQEGKAPQDFSFISAQYRRKE